MTLLVLSARELPGLLPYPEAVAVMRQALAAHASGEAYQPLRTMIRPPGAEGLMALMPCYLPPPATARRRNPGTGSRRSASVPATRRWARIPTRAWS